MKIPLISLIEDMQSIINTVDEKLGLPKTLNPYKFAQWQPSQESLEKVQNELVDSVMESRIPDSVKDQYADPTMIILDLTTKKFK